MILRLKAHQDRGSWIARLESGFDEIDVNREDPMLAVVVTDPDNKIDWKSRTYLATKPEGEVAWWARPTSERWRQLISSGKPVLLREGLNPETRTAGPKIAFFKISDLRVTDDVLQFKLDKRIAEWE